MIMETKDLILRKAKYEDWESMYYNVWSRPETAKYMLWKMTADEESAKKRIKRSMAWQKLHDSWLVFEKASRQAIGFAGVEKIKPHTWQDASIALGPEFTGKGYGKQILQLLIEYCISLDGQEFYYSTRAENLRSKALAMSCGFIYQYSEQKTDLQTGKAYELEIFKKDIH